MRKWINLVEKIVHRSQGEYGGDRPYVVAIDPTRSEWTANFPKGAAGVLLTDGRLVVGDGACLAHDTMLDMASIDQRLEKYRLQLGPTRGYAELWIDDEIVEDENHTEQDIIDYVVKRYGSSPEEIGKEITRACQRFSPSYECRGVACNPSVILDADMAWAKSCWPS